VSLLRIERDDLAREVVHDLLREHLADMHALSPPESVHALDLGGLRRPDITFWTVWDGLLLLGCGALKQLDAHHGEIKSMRTPRAHRGRGAARAVLAHILEEARRRGYRRVSLETGSHAAFQPAQALYRSFGFATCGPFADYRDDPNSVFMTLALQPR
jgi:putative acetyltransferase